MDFKKPVIEKEKEELAKELALKQKFITNWRSFQKYDESPMETYFRELDLMYRNLTDQDYFEKALQEDVGYMNQLLITDFKFRNDAKLNVVMSISDVIEKTGSGKSSAGIYFGLLLAKIFGAIFAITNILWTPEEFDKKIENAENKSIFQLDEQRRASVGLMSNTVQLRLEDYEDMLRQSQICLIYCAPQMREHNHFFAFNTYRMTRINNPKCEHCNADCSQCSMPFHERSGYPKSVFLMLKTKRITTGLPVARGLVEVPMPNPQIMQEYWKMKDENVAKLKRKEENAWQQMKEVAVKIYNLKKDELVFQKKKGGWRVASKNQITIAIYDVIGMRYLTNKALELVEEQIKGLLEGYVAEKEANENIGETEEEEEPLANE